MKLKMFFRISSGIAVLLLTSSALAQQRAIGLYYPDLAACQRMFGPSGIGTIANEEAVKKVIEAWNNISPQGRELLLRERDLAIAVIDSSGRWSFRSSGIPALRSLQAAKVRNKLDLLNLERVLEYKGFQELREFFRQQLFGRAANAVTFGSPLRRLEQVLASNAEKDWFRGIIGAEMLDLDSATRTALIKDPTYGNEVSAAISTAQVTREKQLNDVWNIAVAGEPSTEIRLSEVEQYLPEGKDDVSGGFVSYGIGTVNGKNLLLWSKAGRTFILSPERDDRPLSFDFTKTEITAALKNGTARVFCAAPGGSRVAEVTVGRTMANTPVANKPKQ